MDIKNPIYISPRINALKKTLARPKGQNVIWEPPPLHFTESGTGCVNVNVQWQSNNALASNSDTNGLI